MFWWKTKTPKKPEIVKDLYGLYGPTKVEPTMTNDRVLDRDATMIQPTNELLSTGHKGKDVIDYQSDIDDEKIPKNDPDTFYISNGKFRRTRWSKSLNKYLTSKSENIDKLKSGYYSEIDKPTYIDYKPINRGGSRSTRKTMKSTKKQTKKSKSYKRRTIKKHVFVTMNGNKNLILKEGF